MALLAYSVAKGETREVRRTAQNDQLYLDTWMTSRLRRVCHLALGSRVRVTKSSSSCSGLMNTSCGVS